MEKVKCIIEGKLVIAEKISEKFVIKDGKVQEVSVTVPITKGGTPNKVLFNGRVVDAEVLETVQLNKYHVCHQVGDHVCGYNFFGKSFSEASKDAETKELSIIYISISQN